MNTLPFDQLLEVRRTGRCPVCQETVDARGVSGHVRGKRHKTSAKRAELVDRGFSIFSIGNSAAVRQLELQGIEYEWLDSGFGRGRELWTYTAVARLITAYPTNHFGVVLARLGQLDSSKRAHVLKVAQVSIALGATPYEAITQCLGG